jgi:hypothetical protein
MTLIRARRKAVSSIIGGIIILTLILTALTAMVLVAQQYDTYQTVLNVMSQKDIDRFSENLIAVYPGITGPQLVSGCGSTCNQYNMSLSNLGGIGTQIMRIYINSTSGCDNLCVFNPSPSGSSPPTQFQFQSSNGFINPAEAAHALVFWLPYMTTLPTDSAKANTVSLVTSRGRTFTFQWPFPPAGNYVPTDLHLDIGPIRITYDPNLITFTTNSTPYNFPGALGCANSQPSSTPCLSGGWTTTFPTRPADNGFVFYLRFSNIGTGPVKLLDKSYVLVRGWKNGMVGSLLVLPFYIVRPMSQYCHDNYFASSYLDPTWAPAGACPTPLTFAVYNSSLSQNCASGNPCYSLPQGPSLGIPGTPVYVLFSATAPQQTTVNKLTASYNYVLYVQLCYLYQGYEYSLTIPLISIVT